MLTPLPPTLLPPGTGGAGLMISFQFQNEGGMKLDLSVIWDRITSPKTESGGATPTPDDFRLITSIGIDF